MLERCCKVKKNGCLIIEESIVNKFETPKHVNLFTYSHSSISDFYASCIDYHSEDLKYEKVMNLFNKHVLASKDLMINKNHDYGEAWRDMRVSSLTDLILQKLLRVKQIEDNNGSTIMSEGIDANYLDMLNYAVFALIKLNK